MRTKLGRARILNAKVASWAGAGQTSPPYAHPLQSSRDCPSHRSVPLGLAFKKGVTVWKCAAWVKDMAFNGGAWRGYVAKGCWGWWVFGGFMQACQQSARGAAPAVGALCKHCSTPDTHALSCGTIHQVSIAFLICSLDNGEITHTQCQFLKFFHEHI